MGHLQECYSSFPLYLTAKNSDGWTEKYFPWGSGMNWEIGIDVYTIDTMRKIDN